MQEIKIGMLGNVDCGKTSTTSVLINKILDDGRGSARSLIFKHKHEKTTGRTSSISENFLKIDNRNKYITFVDLAGHEKYLKTTMFGLSGYYIDYVLVFVGANMGISMMTQEHLILAITLKIPFIFVITKTDLAPANILNGTLEDIKKLVKRMVPIMPIVIEKEGDFIDKTNFDLAKNYPIFNLSNKTGNGIDLLRNYLVNLSPRFNWEIHKNDETNFIINHRYNVKGIGTVFSGKLIAGKIKKGDKLLLGPFNGKWININAKSLHDNFRNEIEELNAGESGCVAVKGKSDDTTNIKGRVRKGVVLINKVNKDAIRYFDAEIAILTKHSTTIKKGYSPIINCNTIVQTAKIVEIYDEKNVLRCGDKARVKFKFMFRPEYLKNGERLVFRDGRTKGFGKIIRIYENKVDD